MLDMLGLLLALIALTLAGLLLLLLLLLSRENRHRHPRSSLPPGPRGLPLIGSLLELRPREHLTFTRWRKEYGNLVLFYKWAEPIILLNSYAAMKEAFVTKGDAFSGRPTSDYLKRITHDSGIVLKDGPVWQEQRRFVLRVLRDFGFGRTVSEDIIRTEAEAVLRFIDARNGRPINTREIFTSGVNNVIAKLAFGERTGADDPQFPEFLRHIDEAATRATFASLLPVIFPSLLNFPKLLRLAERLGSFRAAMDFSHDLVAKKIKEHEEALGSHVDQMDLSQAKDVCDALLIEKARHDREQGSGSHSFTSWQILRNLVELFLAGTDTTATTMSWALLYMAGYPKVQEQVQEELDTKLGRARRPCMKDRPNLPVVTAVVDEVMRCSSIARSGVPHRTTEDTQVLGYVIPKGYLVMPNLYGIHHDPQLWERPDDFWPGHFLDDHGMYKASPYLNPFSIGKRACLGETLAKMELFLFFSTVMQSFSVRLADPKTDVTTLAYGTGGQVRRPLPHEVVLERRRDEV